jgi:hypothetical protein
MAIYMVVSVIVIALLAVHVTDVWGWHVDWVTFALLGALLVLPVAERLRKFKVGNIEADFETVKANVQQLKSEVSGLRERTLNPEEESEPSSGEPVEEDSPGVAARGLKTAARTIEQIVWADDRPANNRLEIAELRRRFSVITANTTQEALEKISVPEATMVITDAVRVENDKTNYEAGLELLNELQSRHPMIPAYVYCGPTTAKDHAEPLRAAGARLVTASFTQLADQIKMDARTLFHDDVREVLRKHGAVEEQGAGTDFVLTIGQNRIGVEARDFRRTPKAAAFDRSIGRLEDAIRAGRIGHGLLVTPRDVFVAKQRARTPETVELLSIDGLAEALAAYRDPLPA